MPAADVETDEDKDDTIWWFASRALRRIDIYFTFVCMKFDVAVSVIWFFAACRTQNADVGYRCWERYR